MRYRVSVFSTCEFRDTLYNSTIASMDSALNNNTAVSETDVEDNVSRL